MAAALACPGGPPAALGGLPAFGADPGDGGRGGGRADGAGNVVVVVHRQVLRDAGVSLGQPPGQCASTAAWRE